MGVLTGLLYACLAVFAAGWYFNKWSGNFSLLLFILSVVTFGYWLAERFHFAPQRRRAVAEFEKQDAARREQLAAQGITRVDDNSAETRQALLMQPWWLDWTAGLFPVILAVFLLRSFLFEPFKIPSGLDEADAPGRRPDPGQQVPLRRPPAGDQPEDRRQLNDPQRGDVMVFRYPQDPSTDYIKRVVGLPGDEVSFRGQRLYLNGQAAPLTPGRRVLRRRYASLREGVHRAARPGAASHPH